MVATMLLLAVALGAPVDRLALARARQFYNQEKFDEAIAAARDARQVAAQADAAAVVLARALLERYRASANAGDLSAAREAIRAVHVERLSPRDRVEFLVAIGQSLFLEGEPGAAAEMFDLALSRASFVDLRARDRLLEWWASALDRQAQAQSGPPRAAGYRRILERMEGELTRDDSSPPANYWVVAAARGAGDLDRAWQAAVAAWVRGGFMTRGGAGLRTDVDRLVEFALIPERARLPGGKLNEQTAAALRTAWEAVKERWK